VNIGKHFTGLAHLQTSSHQPKILSAHTPKPLSRSYRIACTPRSRSTIGTMPTSTVTMRVTSPTAIVAWKQAFSPLCSPHPVPLLLACHHRTVVIERHHRCRYVTGHPCVRGGCHWAVLTSSHQPWRDPMAGAKICPTPMAHWCRPFLAMNRHH
jgi:hypothetical protein